MRIFMTEVRYKGTKVVSVVLDYAENVKFAESLVSSIQARYCRTNDDACYFTRTLCKSTGMTILLIMQNNILTCHLS